MHCSRAVLVTLWFGEGRLWIRKLLRI
jgi:hypothetical protein